MAPKNAQKLIDKADQALYAAYEEIKDALKIHQEVLNTIKNGDYDADDDLSDMIDAFILISSVRSILGILVDDDDDAGDE